AAADALAVLLQTGQHDLVALAHLGAAQARDVAGTGIMLVRRLRERARGNQDKGNAIKESAHREPPSISRPRRRFLRGSRAKSCHAATHFMAANDVDGGAAFAAPPSAACTRTAMGDG